MPKLRFYLNILMVIPGYCNLISFLDHISLTVVLFFLKNRQKDSSHFNIFFIISISGSNIALQLKPLKGALIKYFTFVMFTVLFIYLSYFLN